MWKNLNCENVEGISKVVAEFEVTMNSILPYGKMKIKIYEDQSNVFTGYTDINIKLISDDGYPEGAVGFGKTEREALTETIRNFNELVEREYPKEKYPNGLEGEHIEYTDPSDF